MKTSLRFPSVAVLAALSCNAQAEITLDVINGSEITLDSLIQADSNFFDNDLVDLNGADTNDGKNQEFEVRRAEIILKGKGVRFDWQLGYDARANKFLDTVLRYKMGTAFLQAGQYKQPNSLEELTSTRHNDFISKAMTTNLFGVARRVGVSYGVENPNWGYTVGAFGRELTRNLAHGSGFGARGYWAPINDTEGQQFLHLGLSVVDYDTDADTLRLRVRPDADLATARLIDTGNLTNTDRQRTIGLEGAYVQGPLKVQAEYMRSDVDRYRAGPQPGGNFTGDSWYVYGLWNITGETWTYKAGTPVTPYPNEPASGMWQVGLRYDAADLNDAPVLGGEEQNLTVGVNWYWRTNFKFMANYVKVSSEKFSRTLARDVSDDPSIFELRGQLYW